MLRSFLLSLAALLVGMLVLGLGGPAAAQSINASEINRFSWIPPIALQPGPRAFHSLTSLDYPYRSLLVFGGSFLEANQNGSNLTIFNDLWLYEMASNTWTNMNNLAAKDSSPPPARAAHSACSYGIENVSTEIVIFGGYTINSSVSQDKFPVDVENGTVYAYSFLNNLWTTSSQSNGPGPRWGAATACTNTSMFIFGGLNGDYTPVGPDLWVFDFDTVAWTRLFPPEGEGEGQDVNVAAPIAPAGRGFAGMSYLNTNELVLFGGYSDNVTIQNNTWWFNLTSKSWTLSAAWTPNLAAMGTINPDAANIHIIGGTSFPVAISMTDAYTRGLFPASNGESFVYNTTSDAWSMIWRPPSLTSYIGAVPTPRHGLAATFLYGLPWIFGGTSTNTFTFWDDLWTATLVQPAGLWATKMTSLVYPPLPLGATMNVIDNLLLLFGGWGDSTMTGAPLWTFNPNTTAWNFVFSSVYPPYRALHASAVIESQLIVFGGANNMNNGSCDYYNDLWSIYPLDKDPKWKAHSPTIVPSPRASLVAGMHHGDFYVFLGKGPSGGLNDVWKYSFSSPNSTWMNMTLNMSGLSPSPRWGVNGAVVSDSMVIYGGHDFFQVFKELWVYSFLTNTWEYIPPMPSPATSPPPLTYFSAASTPAKLIIYGGAQNASFISDFALSTRNLFNYSSAVYEFHLPSRTWLQVVTAGFQTTRVLHVSAMIYNTTLVTYGGDFTSQLTSDIVTLPLGCNSGYYSSDYATEACLPCPRGNYSNIPGSTSCPGRCPEFITTASDGAASINSCTVCTKEACHGNGDCSVTAALEVSCRCYFGYHGSDSCAIPIVYIIIGSSVGGLLVLVLVFFVIRRIRSDTSVAYSLLEVSKKEVHDLTKAWQIPWDDVHCIRRIDADCEGTYGEVWLAEWAGREVAVKKLREVMVQLSIFNQSVTTNFEREIKILRQLRHKNIVFFYGAGTLNDTPYIVIEYISRGSLKAILGQPEINISPRRRLLFARDTAEGLVFLHSLNRFHRDIKSANLLVTEDWTVKISDFGTASLINKLQQETQRPFLGMDMRQKAPAMMTTHVGTLFWMSPEILRGQRYDASTDIYSYGIVLWEILYREMPYNHLASKDYWEVHGYVESGGRPYLPKDIDPKDHYIQLMRDCWADHPDARPTAEQVVQTLQLMLTELDASEPTH